ncbi:phosphoglycerate kinase [Desulfurispira natronophila]|uniref:Phosphoglycerate kinase n=1 Tax=Desulfurispira natronophila TaxID=682562 RepID=A0A7W7Y360_9BACT|nr:phosphoglycerate kinase [Desulfurispira natronophila]MBB5021084.1 phosphoglycerate kinase [Desulfurispira natronophila]
MIKKSVRDVNLAAQRVFVRVDFNVPIRDGVVEDTTRIEAAVETIEHISAQGGRVILASHMGRPKGKVNPDMSLRPAAAVLGSLLGKSVKFVDDCVGEVVSRAVDAMADGDIILLENTRFYPGEEANDPEFARKLAVNADVFVCDAFGSAHRAHASTEGITAHVQESVAGFLLERELEYLSTRIQEAKRPFVAILGGAKVSDKIPVIKNLFDKVDAILIGGAMAYTFLAAKGIATGLSFVEKEMVDSTAELLEESRRRGVTIHLPLDHIAGKEFSEVTDKITTESELIRDGYMGLDIGPRTIAHYSEVIDHAKTVLWNGPMGVFEWKSFSEGTYAVAAALANNREAITIVGGGDSVSAIQKSGYADRVSHISTGGGASLELLSGIQLPGIACLANK